MIELNTGEHQSKSRGQAMVEYALILALLAVSFGFAIAATGPAIGNVFCNVVANIGGSEVNAQGAQQCGNAAPNLVLKGGDPALFWATVTWVAGHPQGETPFPTPIRRAPTSVGGGLQTATPTPTASNTPTSTNLPSATNTNTATLVPTAGPSPTTSDFAFTVPFVDQINNKEWWRTDLADTWKAQWYGTQSHGLVSVTNGWPITFSNPKNQTTFTGSNSFTFNFASGSPTTDTGVTATDNFGASFTRTFQLTQATSYTFSLLSDDVANVYIDGQTPPVLWNLTYNGTVTATRVLGSGMHTIKVDYGEDTGGANITFSMTPGATTSGTPDAPEQDNSCSWGQTSGNNNPVSVSFMFEANPGQSTWPAGQTCYLELRGYVDLNAHANPQLSFWDIWDFVGASGLTAQLQIGKYSLVSGKLDRSAFNWQTIATHTAGSKNYAWTRNEVDLTPYKGSLGNNVTFRYVIGGTGGTTFRWFLDDLQILDAPISTTPYTVNKAWSLDTTDQMDDFVFDGDSFRSIQKYGLPTSGSPWRWQLTSNNAHSGMGWDDSPGIPYQNITGLTPNPSGTADPRIHFLQFRNNIDLTGTLPPDIDGDTGNPLLTFWQAYDIKTQASIRVEYYNTATSTWTAIPNQGTLVDYTVPTGTSRTSLTMQPISIDLTNIPNWNTAAFKLRFAMYVDGASTTTFGQGWYIDDIKIEREKPSPFIAYPFVDDAENASFTANTWQAIGGKWNRTTEKGGALTSATAYSDSPLTTYDPGDTQELQMKYAIDLMHDTVSNTSDAAGRPAAVNPVLTFWHQRDITSGASFSVELWTASTNVWTQVWVYTAGTTNFPIQKAWQRVEINLQTATALADGVPWATISSNAALNDDDIKIRFRFDTNASTPSDGVYVDEIHIENASATTQNLWTGVIAGVTGDGPFVDSVENVSPLILGGSLPARWYRGGQWNTTNAAGFYKSASLAFADSPSGNYVDKTFSVLEMVPIINMTNTPAGSAPIMTFWTRYNIGANASFRVDIAYKDATTATSANNYDQIGGWSAWTTQPMMVGVPAPSNVLGGTAAAAVNTWLRGQVNLNSFIGKQIRVRFVANVPSGATLADGQYLDEIAFTYSPNQIAVPMVDNAQSTSNWVTEGTWGLGKDYFIGSGSSSIDFGSFSWVGTYYDCEQMKTGAETVGDCTGNTATIMDAILKRNTDYTALSTFTTTGGKIGPETGLSQIDDINFNWVDGTSRPLSNASIPGLAPAIGFDDTYVVRWQRQVTLNPGVTYNFSTISDDGVRLILGTQTGISTTLLTTSRTDNGLTGSRYIINNWGNHGPTLDYGTFTVGAAPVNTTLTLEFFENTGGSEVILNATSSTYSFTDSPNTGSTPPYTVVTSIFPGNSSLMLNGFFNLSAAVNPVLSYQRLYDLAANNTFSVEISTDGGFSWTQLETQGAGTLLPPGNNWEQRAISLSAYKVANVMIRFRLDTRSATVTKDGVYITDVRVTP